MKKITDERLILRNLQHIRITYIVQIIGILGILGYEFLQGGLEQVRENPLWLVFIVTAVVSAYLSMSVSVEQEREIKRPKKSLAVSITVLIIIAAAAAYLTSITPNFGWGTGLAVAAILFICGFIPLVYVYRLRVKQGQDRGDE